MEIFKGVLNIEMIIMVLRVQTNTYIWIHATLLFFFSFFDFNFLPVFIFFVPGSGPPAAHK